MTRAVEVPTELESILLEQALAMARQLQPVSDAAPDGQVLAVSKPAALRAGRESTRLPLQATLNRQSAPAERKGLLADPDPAAARRHAHHAATRLIKHRDTHPPQATFAAACGDIEFLTDGVMAPTHDGRREFKLARSQRRPRRDAATTADWATRRLPDLTAGVCYATVADCDACAARWPGWVMGSRIDPKGPMSVLADGAA